MINIKLASQNALGIAAMEASDFAGNSSLDAVVPEDSSFDFDKFLANATRAEANKKDGTLKELDGANLLSSILQRRLLHFGRHLATDSIRSWVLLIVRAVTDERIAIYVVLKAPYLEKTLFDLHLAHLKIHLEVCAFGSLSRNPSKEEHEDGSVPRSKETIWTSLVEPVNEPLAIFRSIESDATDQTIYVLWRIVTFLSLSFHSSCILCSLIYRPPKDTDAAPHDNFQADWKLTKFQSFRLAF